MCVCLAAELLSCSLRGLKSSAKSMARQFPLSAIVNDPAEKVWASKAPLEQGPEPHSEAGFKFDTAFIEAT